MIAMSSVQAGGPRPRPLRASLILSACTLLLAAGCGGEGELVACGADLPPCPTSFVCGPDSRCRFDTESQDASAPDDGALPETATLAPATIRVPVGRNHFFRVTALPGAITWSVMEASGGSLTALAASPADAEYTAPLTPGTYTIVADVASDPPSRATAQVEVVAYGVEILAGAAGGRGYYDAIGTDARLGYVGGLTSDGTYVYATDGHTIRRIAISNRAVETLAGAYGLAGSTDGAGTTARFSSPGGLVHAAGALYVSDSSNHTIRKIDLTTKEVTTIAGGVTVAGAVDGVGTAARFSYPRGLAIAGDELYIADAGNHVVRRLTLSTGAVVRLAGTFGGTGTNSASATELYSPIGLLVDGANLYIADSGGNTVRRVDRSLVANNAFTLIAGTYGMPGFVQGDQATARLNYPRGLALVGTKLYVTDYNSVRAIDLASANAVSLVAGDAAGAATEGNGAVARFNAPDAILNLSNSLLVADTNNGALRYVTTAGAVTPYAGKLPVAGSVDGIGSTARFSSPERLVIDGDELYVASGGSTIRNVTLSTRAVTTVAGTFGVYADDDGIGAAAHFNGVSGIAKLGSELFVLGRREKIVRRITLANQAVATIVTPNVALTGIDFPDFTIDPLGQIYIGSRGRLALASTAGGTSTVLVDNVGSSYAGMAFVGGKLYVGDRTRHVIHHIDVATTPPTATIVAGGDGEPGYADGLGTTARFSGPVSLAVGPEGLLYVTDSGNNVVRRVDPATGAVSTLFGKPGVPALRPGPVADATLNFPWGIGVSPEGEVVVTSYTEHCLSRLKRP